VEVPEGGNFCTQVDIVNLDIDPGNYSASYVIAYDADIIEVTGVSNGLIGTTAVPVSSWAYVPAGVQGVIAVVQNLSTDTAFAGDGYLAEIDFDVLGLHCNTSGIEFNLSASAIYMLPGMAPIVPIAWINDSVHVLGPTPTCTGTATITNNVTVTVTPTPTNASGGGTGGGGVPTWVWPVVGIMLAATLGLFLYALYRGGYLDNLMPKLRGWFGGEIEDYIADDFEGEDMYDNLYGDTGPGIGPGSGGGTEMDDDLI
jgi:hypothetical protein